MDNWGTFAGRGRFFAATRIGPDMMLARVTDNNHWVFGISAYWP